MLHGLRNKVHGIMSFTKNTDGGGTRIISEMEIIGIYDDSYPDSALRRMIYMVELGKGIFVDIMVSEESRAVYAMQNED